MRIVIRGSWFVVRNNQLDLKKTEKELSITIISNKKSPTKTSRTSFLFKGNLDPKSSFIMKQIVKKQYYYKMFSYNFFKKQNQDIPFN